MRNTYLDKAKKDLKEYNEIPTRELIESAKVHALIAIGQELNRLKDFVPVCNIISPPALDLEKGENDHD